MKSTLFHRTWFLALSLSLCAWFCSYVIFKNFNQLSSISLNLTDEKDAEQQEEVKEVLDWLLISAQLPATFCLNPSVVKPLIVDEYVDYGHFTSPETPPPNS